MIQKTYALLRRDIVAQGLIPPAFYVETGVQVQVTEDLWKHFMFEVIDDGEILGKYDDGLDLLLQHPLSLKWFWAYSIDFNYV